MSLFSFLQEGDTDELSDEGESSQTEEMIPSEISQQNPSMAFVYPRPSNSKSEISRY